MNRVVLSAFALIALLLIFYAVRNEITYRNRMRAIRICSARAQALIAAGRYSEADAAWSAYENGPSYNTQMLNPLVWRFKDFYPDLACEL